LSVRRILIGSALGAAAGLAAWALVSTPIGGRFEDQTYDWRLARTARASEARADIALVLINESSLRALEPQFGAWPWPRFLHAGAIDFLTRSHARLIVYDVLFTDRDRRTGFAVGGRTMTGAESDAELVGAVRRAGNVVLLADAVFEGLENPSASLATQPPPHHRSLIYQPGPGFEERPPARLPFAELADAALAVGHNFQVRDPDGTDRRVRPFILSRGVAVPSLGVAAALAAEHVPADQVHLEGEDHLRIGAGHHGARDVTEGEAWIHAGDLGHVSVAAARATGKGAVDLERRGDARRHRSRRAVQAGGDQVPLGPGQGRRGRAGGIGGRLDPVNRANAKPILRLASSSS